MIKLSATAMKDYVECPTKLYYRWMDVGSDLSIVSTALIKGGVVHDVIEQYEKGIITADEMPYVYQTLLVKRLAEPNVEFSRWDSVDKLLSSGQKVLYNYLKHKRGEILEVEWSFEFDRETVEGIPYQIIGRIDQIVRIDGLISVIDIKTSRLKPTEFEIAGDYQFTMYAMAYMMQHDVLPANVYNFHLESGDYIEYPRSKTDLKLFRIKMDKIVTELTGIKQWEDHHKDKGWHCNRCMYRQHCYDTDRGMSSQF